MTKTIYPEVFIYEHTQRKQGVLFNKWVTHWLKLHTNWIYSSIKLETDPIIYEEVLKLFQAYV